MNTTKLSGYQIPAGNCGNTRRFLVPALAIIQVAATCLGQGTMTIRFEGQPSGTAQQLAVYRESGMEFGTLTPQSLYLSGGGIPGYPDNGTGYLEIPAGSMRIGPTNTFPTSAPFNLVSLDAAEYDGAGPKTLTVVGYHAMAGNVTNYFTVSSQTFQTFHLDSSFTGVFQVDVLNASWSLDNVVISGVPEPSTRALALLGAGCAFWVSRAGRRRYA